MQFTPGLKTGEAARQGRSKPAQARPLLPLRCALVGSSPIVKHSHFGAEIDGHDVVFRFNFAPTIGYEANVGARTDVRVMNFNQVVSNRSEGSVIIHRSTLAREQEQDWAVNGKEYTVVSTVAKSVRFLPSQGLRLRITSTGYLALLLALRGCAQVTLYGFDITGRFPGHYYDDEREGMVLNVNELLARDPWRYDEARNTVLPFLISRDLDVRTPPGLPPFVVPREAGIFNAVQNTSFTEASVVHNFAFERRMLATLYRAGCFSVSDEAALWAKARPHRDSAPHGALRASHGQRQGRTRGSSAAVHPRGSEANVRRGKHGGDGRGDGYAHGGGRRAPLPVKRRGSPREQTSKASRKQPIQEAAPPSHRQQRQPPVHNHSNSSS